MRMRFREVARIDETRRREEEERRNFRISEEEREKMERNREYWNKQFEDNVCTEIDGNAIIARMKELREKEGRR